MEFLCSVDGETLSRFVDGELSPSEYRGVLSHVSGCPACQGRVTQFRFADGVLSHARITQAQAYKSTRRVAVSLSVAAALVASIATNVLLTPRAQVQPVPRAQLALSTAPSETLTSFYLKVAPSEVVTR